MKRAVLQISDPRRVKLIELAVRRCLPDVGDALVVFSDADEANEWMLMHEPALLILERDATDLDARAIRQLRSQWPMMQQLFIPEHIFQEHPANDIFARQADAILSRERVGFTGTTVLGSLVQLIQFLEYARLDGQLGVRSEGPELSAIGFMRGQLAFARHGRAQGVDALRELLGLERGAFRWSSETVSAPNIAHEDGSRLLLELVRQRDEQRWRSDGIVEDAAFELVSPRQEAPASLMLKTPGGRQLRSATRSLDHAALPARGFVGSFALEQLVDVVQLHAQTQSTGILHIYYGLREAQIHFENGEVVHALCGAAEGESAFIMVMELRQGTFMFSPQAVRQHTIRASLLNLLLGAAREDEDEEELWGGDDLDLFGPMSAGQLKRIEERPGSNVFQRASLGELASEPSQATSGFEGLSMVEALNSLSGVSGFMWSALIHARQGVLQVCAEEQGPDEATLRARLCAMPGLLSATLKSGDILEDTMMITASAYLLLRPLSQQRGAFLALALERKKSNLGIARLRLAAAEEQLRMLIQAAGEQEGQP
jgi:hypothetical protein